MKKFFVLLTVVLFFSLGLMCGESIILAQAAPEIQKPFWFDILNGILGQFPQINAWLVAIFIFLLGFFRALSELLGFIALKTESKKDDAILGKVNLILWWLTHISGWFGAGYPKVIENKPIDSVLK
jgi:hypothetical protein